MSFTFTRQIRGVPTAQSLEKLTDLMAVMQKVKGIGGNLVYFSVNKAMITALKAGGTDYIAQALTYGNANDVSLVINFPEYWWTTTGKHNDVMLQPAAVAQFKIDFAWVVDRYPTLTGVMMEEPGYNGAIANATLLQQWISFMNTHFAELQAILVSRGKNVSKTGSYFWGLNKGSSGLAALKSMGLDFYPGSPNVVNKIFNCFQQQSTASTASMWQNQVERGILDFPQLNVFGSCPIQTSAWQNSAACKAYTDRGIYISPCCYNQGFVKVFDYAIRSGYHHIVYTYHDLRASVLNWKTFCNSSTPNETFLPTETTIGDKIKSMWASGVTPTTGTLDVRSVPTGAAIRIKNTIDNIWGNYGVTNRTKELSPGSYVAELASGGTVVEKPFTVTAGQTTLVSHTFEQAPTTGSLDLRSIPADAEARVDEIYRGNTNLIVPGLAPGTRTIKLHKEGYADAAGTQMITAGQTSVKEFTLTALPTTGSLNVSTIPPAARIWIDGNDTGKNTPNQVDNLTPGSHALKLILNAYNDITDNLTIAAGVTTNKTYSLVSIPTTGSITLKSSPPGAAIKIDGVATGQVTPYTFTNNGPGIHAFELTLAGYQPYSNTVTVTAGMDISRDILMIAGEGALSISTTPEGADVWLNGKLTTYQTNFTANYPAGTYSMTLVMKGFQDISDSILIAPDRVTSKTYTFAEGAGAQDNTLVYGTILLLLSKVL